VYIDPYLCASQNEPPCIQLIEGSPMYLRNEGRRQLLSEKVRVRAPDSGRRPNCVITLQALSITPYKIIKAYQLRYGIVDYALFHKVLLNGP
jgi:hypothetical protein